MKRKLLFAIVALLCSVGTWAQKASYNHLYNAGVEPAAGGNYFLYNIGANMFLTDGMDYGTHASVDNSGRVITLAANTNGFSIYTEPFSANGSDAKKGYLTLNGYVDTGSNDADWVFESVSVDGYTNAYTIKHSDTQYLYWECKDGLYNGKLGQFINVGESTADSYSYWLLIPMSTRQAVGDYSYLLRNTEFQHPWELVMWENTTTWTNSCGGNKENTIAEMYGKAFDVSQTISETITNGRYKIYCQAYYNNADASNQTYLYANTDEATIKLQTQGSAGGSISSAATAFSDGEYVNFVETFVSNGSLKVGLKNAATAGNAWTTMDNFYIEYLGQCVMDYAVALPVSGDMAADTWYYFDIAIAGDNYNATAATLGDIICTDDGYTLTSAASGNITLNAENNDLAVKRYYVKSSSANNLVVAPASFTYTLGSITAQSIAEDEYIKALTTFVITYGDAATSDGSASLAVIGSPVATLTKGGATVTTGTLTANNAAKTLTATFSDVELVINSTDYSITIPAGAFGYEGQATNAAITLNFNTPLFADGSFYMKNKGNSAYLAAGLSWSSQSITNTIGRVVDIAALPNGKFSIDTHVKNNATDHYLGNNLFCDAGQEDWTFASDGDGGYTISNDNGYLQANAVGAALSQTASASAATNWTLLTAEDWKTEQVARLDAAAADNGVDATFYLPAANFNRNDTENSKWNGGPGFGGTNENFNAEKYDATPFDVYQELTDLKPGAYKVTMNGFYRNGTTDERNAILYANSYEVPLLNIRSTKITAQDDDKGFTTANGDYFVPNTQEQAAKAFTNAYYNNELNFTVASDGVLRIGVKKDTGAGADWAVFDNFQLTYYGVVVISEDDAAAACATGTYDVQITRTLKGGQWNGFSVPFGFAVAGSALEGAEVKQFKSVSDNEITLEDATEIVAGEPYLVKPTSNVENPSFSGVAVSNPEEAVKGDGSYKFSAHLYNTALATDGSVAYVSTTDSSIKKLTGDGSSIKGMRAIFNVPTGAGARALSVNFGDGTTGIATVENGVLNIEENAPVYNLAGQRVSKAQKGVYIQNGKKVIKK